MTKEAKPVAGGLADTFGIISPRLPHIFYGGDYNPEQWPEETWQEDVRLMEQAGVNLVSVGIFSWARLEPRPGQYEFGWLDRIMDLLEAHGICVSLATATASPPPWLAKHHPESLPVTREGVKLWPGARQHYCPSSPAYRQAAQALVAQIAKHYHDHPALVMWHVGNEYGCHVPACYCDVSAAAFRSWLLDRYGTLDALNEAWGTTFWSQAYAEWDEIHPPRCAPASVNPTQQLDFQRFCSDAWLECFELERTILKEITPHIPVTTNFMGFFKPLNYWKWAAREDMVSYDNYPDPANPQAAVESALCCDLMRSLGNGHPWLLMEQATSQVNWRPHNVLKRPGQMRLFSYQALARGANGILFFQWRASRFGAEKFHGAMVPHIGTETSRIWSEVTRLGAELKHLDVVLPTRVNAEIAILFDWENWWALEVDGKPSHDLKLMGQVRSYYTPLFKRNIAVDFVSPEADLAHYRVVLVPNLYLVRDGAAETLERFVARGGMLVMSFFSGIVDRHDHVRLGGYPGPFRKLLGLRVEEFDPYIPGQMNQIRLARDRRYQCDLWSDIIELEGAQALAYFENDFYAGRPALTQHPVGKGMAYYLGTRPEPDCMDWLLREVCTQAGVSPPLVVPEGVEVTRRLNGDTAFLFALNHNPTPVQFSAPMDTRDLLTGREFTGEIQLEPFGVTILTERVATD